jgi:2-polyprenyl-3-methyl-5-hydroxy-6-metoxy-1,4-benzoquinol methylase
LRFRSRDYNRRVSRVPFDHYRCPRCQLIFISPVPERLGDYYPKDYHFVPESTDALDAAAVHERYKMEIVQRHVQKGRLLEIGPSLGGFAHLAKRSGFEVEAIEMDAECSAFLNQVAGIPTVHSGDVPGSLRSLKPYDVIALWHVIEHLEDPWAALDAMADSMKPGGILVIAAPNPDAFQFRVQGRRWPHVDAPRHLMLIPARVLIERMATRGMTVELNTTTDEGGLGWNVFGWEFFFSNLVTHPRVVRAARMLGRWVARALGPVERTEGRGSAYTLVLRKAG